MKRRAAISGLEKPSRASRAIWASWAVRSSWVSTTRLRTRPPAGLHSPLGAARERLETNPRAHLVRGAPACSRASNRRSFLAQPLAVEQIGASERYANAAATEPFDCLAVQMLGGFAPAEQRAAARLYPQRPIGTAGPRGLREALERVSRGRCDAGDS